MALATTCPQCKTSFKVVPDQLKLRRGLVRCGVCQHVFSGIDFLRHVDDAARAAARPARVAGPTGANGQPPSAAGHAPPAEPHAPAADTPASDRDGVRGTADAPPAALPTGIAAGAGTGTSPVISPPARPPALDDADEGLKTAFFLTDSAFGPLPGDDITQGPDTRSAPSEAPPVPGATGAAAAGTPAPYASLPVLPFTEEPPSTPTVAPAPDARPASAPGVPALSLRPERATNLPERAAARAVLEPDALTRHGPGTLLVPDAATRQGPRTRFGNAPDTAHGSGTLIVPEGPGRPQARARIGPDEPTRHGPPTILAPGESTRQGLSGALPPAVPIPDGPRTRFGSAEPGSREAVAAPAIDYFSSGQRRSTSLGLALSPAAWAAAALLSLVLALQALVGWRDAIAARIPALAPLVSSTLGPLGWPIAPPRELGSLTIESFELQVTGAPNQLRMIGVLRNRGDHAVGFPAIELTLTDSAGALLVRKAIPANVYLGAAAPAELPGGVPARSERPIRLVLEHDGLQPTGFSVALFHP